MSTEVINTNDYNELCAAYNWFSEIYPSAIQKAGDDFVLPGLRFTLISVSKNINILMDKDSYFVTKIRIDEFHDMFFRSSEKAVDILLEKSIGKPNSKFNINRLTDLEAKIVTGFNDYMYKSIKKYLSPAPPTVKRTNFDVVHLTFLLTDDERKLTGKFIITMPEVLLKPEIIEEKQNDYTEDNFLSCSIPVDLKIGATRLKVIDLKNIEIDDVVVFDDSNIIKWILKYKDFEYDVNIEPNLELTLPFDNNEGEDNMADNANLWDSIEVDLTAHFDSVKISLGDLKKIQQGLVVDVSSIYNNKVTLSVEDKDIAYGELVIVNDRYGVKVNELVAGAAESASVAATDAYVQEETTAEEQQTPKQMHMPPQPETSTQETTAQNSDEEDEFDYSDFELEDEDI